MCLTVPSKILEIGDRKAIVQSGNTTGEVDIFLTPNLKAGDWVLCVGGAAVKKIPQDDAKEIIELLTKSETIDISKLSDEFVEIIKATKTRDLIKEEIIFLLNVDGIEREALFSEANVVRQTYLKDFICIHGIVEFSNFCRNDCAYCGLRRDNANFARYRMSVDEIVETAKQAAHEDGFKLLVLQSGEDLFYDDNKLVEIITKIKKDCRVFIFVSVGERGKDCYQKMRDAGASGALFRFETSNPELFKKFHPQGKNFQNRLEHLDFMKKMGYFLATGSLVGLPGQTVADLADDILMTKKWANMVSMGPFIPCDNTPLANFPHGSAEMCLKVGAILRLVMKSVRIPVVTALETLMGEAGRKRGLWAGANALMFNVTPSKYHALYKIYPDKFYQKESIWKKYGLFKYEESYKMLEERMQKELKK